MVEERIVWSSIANLIEALVELGYTIYPDYINVYNEDELDQQIVDLIEKTREEGIEPRTVLIAIHQGPEGDGELYVTNAPLEIVKILDETLEKLENELDDNVVEFALKLLRH